MNTTTVLPDTGPVLNISSYLFASLSDLKPLRDSLRRICRRLDLRGTILLSTEGINLFVAGPDENVHKLLDKLRQVPGLEKLEAKESFTSYQPFRRMLVKIKKEIIAFGVDGIEPAQRTAPKLPPQQLKQWLDEGKPLMLYDVRNDYEVKVGTFAGAVPAGIDTFRDFPQAVSGLPDDAKSTPVVMFCTGGIRCEKAGPFMQQAGFQEVYQLEGGILKYFELVGGDHYQGDCFVFDQRVAVDPSLQESAIAQCFACQAPLTTEEQKSPLYVPGQSCPHCFQSSQEAMAGVIARRQAKLKTATNPLPGSIPYTNTRRLYVSSEQKGKTLYEVLAEKVPAASQGFWEKMVAQRLLVEIVEHQDERLVEYRAVDPHAPLTPGQHFEQRYPGTTEPDVSTDLQILYEDTALVVVNKPAPLPMHPCGRFNKNSLISFLEQVYHPQKLRIAHRLDANTTGVAVLSRTSAVARQVQPQFEQGRVEKRYLARVHGHPTEDAFICEEPIGTSRVRGGGRRVEEGGQSARTDFIVRARLEDGTALLEVSPKTGRTNQIRLHLWHLGFPIVGDPMYQPDGVMQEKQTLGIDEPPMCLHAWEVTFRHPQTAEMVTFQAPPPAWAE
ncbi:sulfurtransferase [Blastopirellula marina]|uniref:tRNA uridine(34) hydroxylase n=1 Tax=Blastopirellula marina TaxID=124 RepID=A0A2S8G1K1_9BACT|nr:sulfurtransferase [Blastopirellula marina]PQO38319.1 sulfurtransferase [Blastopirellula marina]PTL44975.1 sulfurtransferase [Blastopirellula marina]